MKWLFFKFENYRFSGKLVWTWLLEFRIISTTADPIGRSLAGIAGSNPAGGMDVCLLWVLCVVR